LSAESVIQSEFLHRISRISYNTRTSALKPTGKFDSTQFYTRDRLPLLKAGYYDIFSCIDLCKITPREHVLILGIADKTPAKTRPEVLRRMIELYCWNTFVAGQDSLFSNRVFQHHLVGFTNLLVNEAAATF
jgi:hypothetical protein